MESKYQYLILFFTVYVLYLVYEAVMYPFHNPIAMILISMIMGVFISGVLWIGYKSFIEMTQGKEKES